MQTEDQKFFPPGFTEVEIPYPPLEPPPIPLGKKCNTTNCTNHESEGKFEGDYCTPCHNFITEGVGIFSQAYRNAKQHEEDQLNFKCAMTAKTFQEFKAEAEKIYLLQKLKENKYNVAATAREIDIQRSHLYNKIERYGLLRPKK